MAKQTEKLTALRIKSLTALGHYSDGDGLFLQVTGNGAKSWLFKYRFGGKRREMGLGSLRKVSLAQAREEAARCRSHLGRRVDPIEARDAGAKAGEQAKLQLVTFDTAAKEYIAMNRAGWKSAKHAQQWENTLATYCTDPGQPLSELPVKDVDTELVLKVLQPIWATKTETAGRLRNRIEIVLDYARAKRMRDGDNPARWRGHLDAILPEPKKVKKVEHHAALPYKECPAFLRELLATEDTPTGLALAFAVLTATRTSETLGATWDELDLDQRTWTIPGARIKNGDEHVVPLSDAAMQVLSRAEEMRCSTFVFPGRKTKSPLSNMALSMRLRQMRADVTVHGFRSSFRDWASETTEFAREVCEMALGHRVDTKTEKAYRRGNLLERRRALMVAWADYLIGQAANNVVPLRAA